jgi:hypothetical protein
MKFKSPSVTLEGVRPEALYMLPIIERIFNYYEQELTITCTTLDHPQDDPHTHGFAVDCRTHGISVGVQAQITEQIQGALGNNYFVQNEFPGRADEHIHCQLRKDLWHSIIEKEQLVGAQE